MKKVVTNEQMRRMDQHTIQQLGVPGIVLMENAGLRACDIIMSFCEEHDIHSIYVFAGKGNNGGDGFVIARHLFKNGFTISILTTALENDLHGDALTNYQICSNFQIPMHHIQSKDDLPIPALKSLFVDALFGTGIKGAVKGFYKELIDWMNTQKQPVAAIDIPSGLNGNSAEVDGPAVKAAFTITMALPKCAHLFYPSRSYVADLHVVDIGMPALVENDPQIALNLIEPGDIMLPAPEPDQNKYRAGTAFILAGSPGMTGAAVMAAQGAALTGAGLITLGVPEKVNAIVESKLTEQLTLPLSSSENGVMRPEALNTIFEKIDAVDSFLVGPGMGREEQTLTIIKASIEHAIKTETPTVIDADALFLLSQEPELTAGLTESFVLTPHHGEFIRISGHKKHDLQATPWLALKEFIDANGCTVDLKGAPSMCGSREKGIYINSSGNAGLAKGGSGDILAGLIAGFLSRNITALDSTIFANWLHGFAADLAAEEIGITTLQPTDLLYYLKIIIAEKAAKGNDY